MPHLFVNRHRTYGLLATSRTAGSHFVWESVNAILYIFGGITFVTGSVFFFPQLSALENWGVWSFFVGSVLYLVVTVHDLLEVMTYRRLKVAPAYHSKLELVAAALYLSGTILFLVGSVLFFSFVGNTAGGAWCFIVGSGLFVLGAAVNVAELRRGTAGVQRLFNLTAVSFVVGSTLFLTASVPYLWDTGGNPIAGELFAFLAAQYVIGSALFLLGGLLNYRRAWLMVLRAIRLRRQPVDVGAGKG